LNNLAMVYGLQGRNDDGEALIKEIHERFPDYLFATVAIARMHMRDKQYDAAEELLKPLPARRKLHYSEAQALFTAQIELHEWRGNHDAAKTWLDMWARLAPDHPEVRWRQILYGSSGVLERMLGRQGRK
jgi:tetratricopeptide (TPR) repeat protein